jgi:hypothetical protein
MTLLVKYSVISGSEKSVYSIAFLIYGVAVPVLTGQRCRVV